MASLTTPQPKKKNLLKFIFNGILFLSLTALAIYYVLRDDPVNTFKMLGKARFLPILYAVTAFFVTLRLDGTNILSLTRRYKKDYNTEKPLSMSSLDRPLASIGNPQLL